MTEMELMKGVGSGGGLDHITTILAHEQSDRRANSRDGVE